MDPLKMYFLLKMGMFQPAMLVYVSLPEGNTSKYTCQSNGSVMFCIVDGTCRNPDELSEDFWGFVDADYRQNLQNGDWSGQIRSRPKTRPTSPKWWFSKGNPLFQEIPGWWNIIIWPDWWFLPLGGFWSPQFWSIKQHEFILSKIQHSSDLVPKEWSKGGLEKKHLTYTWIFQVCKICAFFTRKTYQKAEI